MDEKKLINPIIDIKRDSNTDKKLINPIKYIEKEKNIEDKIYIILYVLNDAEGREDIFTKIFSVCKGRTSAYTDIRDKLISGLDIDVHASKIITETRQTETSSGDIRYYMIPYNECISLYAFCKSVELYYSYDDFSIEDYSDGVIDENSGIEVKSIVSEEVENYRNMLNDSMDRNKFENEMRARFNPENNI